MARILNKHKQTNTPLKRKVLVAMSGGVDSSVAAALLVRAGHDVTGAFMIDYDGEIQTDGIKDSDRLTSCWRADYQDAVRVAAKLKIPLLKLDFTKEYKKLVLDYMFREYETGRTPNPDVLCNKFIKFGVWLTQARKMGFDFLATGHYARVECVLPLIPSTAVEGKAATPLTRRGGGRGRISLFVSKDSNKDQTYFLHQLSPEQLRHVLFPIGDYTKPEVREMARKWKLPTAEKEESMGICFVGEVPMKQFLMQRIKPKPGNIVLSDNAVRGMVGAENFLPSRVIGRHDGLAFYTIGQRVAAKIPNSKFQIPNKSQISNSKAMYIVDKDIKNNVLMVGYEDDPLLYKKEVLVKDLNWVSGQPPKFPLQCKARLRHRQPLQKCVVRTVETHRNASIQPSSKAPLEGGRGVLVRFTSPQRAVTPGQFAVFYKHGECLGGGVIE